MSNLFDGVPEGTTHRYGCVLYKFTDDAVFIWSGGHWDYSAPQSAYNDGSMDQIIARPKPWSGPEDGLPPIGTKVKIGAADGNEWLEHFEGREAEIIAHNVSRSGDPTAVFKTFDDDGFPIYHAMVDHPRNFLAAVENVDARETAIRELMDIAQVDCRVTAARLVDAGFKREVV